MPLKININSLFVSKYCGYKVLLLLVLKMDGMI